MDEQIYKIKIDKQALTDFFMKEGEPTSHQLQELRKVFNVVMIKHFSKYYNYTDDLVQYALLAVFERRQRYDPFFSAYNYVYSIFRNEVGNKIHKLVKELYVDDILSFKEKVDSSSPDELPQEIRKYYPHLTGTLEYDYIRIPHRDVLNLAVYLRLHESRRKTTIPSFIEEDPTKSIQVLYKLLKEIYDC